MNKGELLGFFRWILPVPPVFLRRRMAALARRLDRGPGFLTARHREMHRFAVNYLITTGRPLETMEIAAQLKMTIDRAEEILGDLEKRAGLLMRNREGTVTGAYPVTTDEGAGRVVLATGEQIGVVGALDALAVPYLAGRLRGVPVAGHFTTACTGCRRPLHVLIGSDISLHILEGLTEARIFLPVMGGKTGAQGVIFCLQGSAFFCSEEHAREERHKYGGVAGIYLTTEQSTRIVRDLIDIIFGFI